MNKELSICIPTYNRPEFLKEMIEKALPQFAEKNVPIYISDNSENDETFLMIEELRKKYKLIFYKKNEKNLGIDRNIVASTTDALSEFVWICSDDDELTDSAISDILDYIKKNKDVDTFIINSMALDQSMSTIINPNITGIENDKLYADSELLLKEISWYTTFVGALVVRKSRWDSVDHNKYLDTVFVHVGKIFEFNEAKALFIAKTLIRYRTGNASWSSRYLEIELTLWRKTINLLPLGKYSEYSKRMAIESVVSKFVGINTLVGLRIQKLLNLKSFKEHIWPYYLSSNKLKFNNLKILFASLALLFIPPQMMGFIKKSIRIIKSKR